MISSDQKTYHPPQVTAFEIPKRFRSVKPLERQIRQSRKMLSVFEFMQPILARLLIEKSSPPAAG